MKVSACWIAKNEEKKLPRSIESVRDAVDELVVLDTGSSDNTVSLAEGLGAKVYHFDWVNDFSAARNRCLELTEGEAVVFIDADEWFEPALQQKDRELIVKLFSSDPELDALQISRVNLGERGNILDRDGMNRVIRKRNGLSFQGRVHEQYLRAGGANAGTRAADAWTLLHDGYAASMGADKIGRNIPLLEQTTRDQDAGAAFHAHCYLIREYSYHGEAEKQLAHLRAVLDNPQLLRQFCQKMGYGFLMLFPYMLDVAADNQGKVNIPEVERKILVLAEQEFPNHPYPILARLHWDYRIGLDESKLLAGIDGAIAAARRVPPPAYSFHLKIEALLLLRAAQAAELRGESERAAGYAAAGLKTGIHYPGALHVLLRRWRGTPFETVEARLREIFPDQKRDQLGYLARHSGLYGYMPLTVSYLKQLARQGPLTGEYLFAFLLLTGRGKEAIELAHQHGDKAARANPLLNEFAKWDIAKAMDAEADGKYLLSAGMYEDIIARAASDQAGSPELVVGKIHSLCCLGRYKEAIAAMLPYLSDVPADKNLLLYLQAASESLGGELGQMARNIRALTVRYLGREREWGGLARTGYAVDRYDKKSLGRLKNITEAELAAEVKADGAELATETLLADCESAADLYEAKKMPAMALECYRFAYAHGRGFAQLGMGRMIAALAK